MEKVLRLPEYQSKQYPGGEIPTRTIEEIRDQYSKQVSVEYPSPKTGGSWELKNRGYAGRVVLKDGWSIVLEPKVTLSNLFSMMEYAYGLNSVKFRDGHYNADTIDGFLNRIASILAQNISRRSNQGFHKEYVEKEEESTFVRGKIDLQKTIRKPWKPEVHQKYRDLTADIEDNQILLWTAYKTLSSDLLDDETRSSLREAVRSLQEIATLQEFSAADCAGRTYRRLNSDYEYMHSLCRLLLDNSGPTRKTGEQKMTPFTVEMPTLYERFVAEWLDRNTGADYEVNSQETVTIHKSPKIQFDIDFVIRRGGEVVAVGDTKYKTSSRPKTEDISQIISYADYYGVEDAFLVYPQDLQTEFEIDVGNVTVRDCQYKLEGDIEENGESCRGEILSHLRV